MDRSEAIAIARKHINACHNGSFPGFEPVEWVILAIMDAGDPNRVSVEPEPNQDVLPF